MTDDDKVEKRVRELETRMAVIEATMTILRWALPVGISAVAVAIAVLK